MGALSNLFGYILNFIYNLVSNYGVAIILFSILLKLLLLPLSIKQQKTLIKTSKIQDKIKEIQKKYTKKDQERISPEEQTKMNQEMMELYKKENISPFSGCLTTIIQLILLLAIFGLVRNPLSNMRHIGNETIEKYSQEMQEAGEQETSTYKEISILNYVNKNKGSEDPLYINMDFLGLDLNKIPNKNFGDFTVYIIPGLYVITSILSMKLTTGLSKKKKEKELIDITDEKTEKVKEEPDMTEQMNKNMSWFMPIMAVSVAIMAPLGLALYWLVNNILMIVERLVINKVLETKKEAENG